MVRVAEKNSELVIPLLVEQIIVTGQMSRSQYVQLTSIILADSSLTNEERRQINQAFDYLQTGRVKLVG